MTDLVNKNFRILVADDHSLIRQGVIFLLEELGIEDNIVQASSLKQVGETIAEEDIDIAIIDAHFPDGNSLNHIAEFKNKKPELKILIFTGIEEELHALKFIKAGANGFVSKLSEEEDVKKAILTVCNGGEYISPMVQTLLMKSLRNPVKVNPLESLSSRELEIAEMYAKGYGNLEIANILDVKQNTISTIKKRILEKLDIESLVQLSEIIRNHQ